MAGFHQFNPLKIEMKDLTFYTMVEYSQVMEKNFTLESMNPYLSTKKKKLVLMNI